MLSFLEIEHVGNTVGAYIGSGMMFMVLFSLALYVRMVLFKTLKVQSLKTETVLDDVLVTIIGTLSVPFYLYISLFAAVQTLQKARWLENVFLITLLLWMTVECLSVVREVISDVSIRYGDKKRTLKAAIALVSIVISIVLWLLGGAIILANLGIDPTTLLAGLGVGGVIVALALQNVVGDLMAYFSLRMDNPITEGDFIEVGDDSGNVERIGLKTTRLRALTGEEIILTNRDILATSVKNYGKADKRGSIFRLTFPLTTPLEKLKQVPSIIQHNIETQHQTEFHRSHLRDVQMTGYVFETFYKVQEHDFNRFCDIHQMVLEGILGDLQKEGYELTHTRAVIAG